MATRRRRRASVAPSTRLSPPAKGIVRGATLAELADVRGQFATAARHAVDAGFDCHLIKPVSVDVLETLLNTSTVRNLRHVR